MVWPTLGSKSAKEQEQEHKPSYCLLDARTLYIAYMTLDWSVGPAAAAAA